VPGDPTIRRRRFAAVAVSAALAVAVALPASGADSPSSLRQRAERLTQANRALAARSRAAVLTLYALDARLARARAQLTDARAQAAVVERRRIEARRELTIARRLFMGSQRNLANRIRAAYEQGDADPLAIVLGAESIDDAVSGIATIKAAAASDRRVVAQARRARATYVQLQRRLGARAARLRRLRTAVAASVDALAAAKSERVAYIHQVATRRRLNAAGVETLEATARSIEDEAKRAALERTAVIAASPAAPATSGSRTLTVLATGYTIAGRTATGAPVGYGVVAVDPAVIPLGTAMMIPGYGEGVAADTGGAVRGAAIDLWFPTPAQAATWGRRTVTITLH
jgi:3D (Asp-Asp-Asp) domain-containing protein